MLGQSRAHTHTHKYTHTRGPLHPCDFAFYLVPKVCKGGLGVERPFVKNPARVSTWLLLIRLPGLWDYTHTHTYVHTQGMHSALHILIQLRVSGGTSRGAYKSPINMALLIGSDRLIN